MSEYAFPATLYVVFSGSQPIGQIIRAGELAISCIPVFSEQLLAERWIDWQRLDVPDLTMGSGDVPKTAELLEQIPARVATHVVMDASRENIRGNWIWPIPKAISLMQADSK